MLRSLGRCCLGKVDLLMAGVAAEMLLIFLNFPLPLLRTHPPSLLVCCFFCGDANNQNSIRTAGGKTCFCLRSGVERATSVLSWFQLYWGSEDSAL